MGLIELWFGLAVGSSLCSLLGSMEDRGLKRLSDPQLQLTVWHLIIPWKYLSFPEILRMQNPSKITKKQFSGSYFRNHPVSDCTRSQEGWNGVFQKRQQSGGDIIPVLTWCSGQVCIFPVPDTLRFQACRDSGDFPRISRKCPRQDIASRGIFFLKHQRTTSSRSFSVVHLSCASESSCSVPWHAK